MTVGQSHKGCLTVRYREQARSHNVRGLTDRHSPLRPLFVLPLPYSAIDRRAMFA
jgi:hypothetical protein